MEKENNGNQENTFSSINNNIYLKLLEKNIIKKNITSTEPNVNNNKKNEVILANLKFGKNLLIWLLKKSNYINVQRTHSTKIRKSNNNFSKKNINKKLRNKLPEKFQIIPRINKLKNLTEESMNNLLKMEQDKSQFYIQTPAPINLFSNNELKQKINRVYNSSFNRNKNLSLSAHKRDLNKNSFLSIN